MSTNGNGAARAAEARAADYPPVVTQFLELSKRVDGAKPKPADRAELKRLLLDNPIVLGTIAEVGRLAEANIIRQVNGKPSVKVGLEANAEALRRDLGEEGASPLERLLIQEAVCCYLNLQLTRYKYENVMGESHTLTLGDYYERKLSAAQRRFLKACETLAKLRRLGLTVLQINVAADGGRQVNVAG